MFVSTYIATWACVCYRCYRITLYKNNKTSIRLQLPNFQTSRSDLPLSSVPAARGGSLPWPPRKRSMNQRESETLILLRSKGRKVLNLQADEKNPILWVLDSSWFKWAAKKNLCFIRYLGISPPTVRIWTTQLDFQQTPWMQNKLNKRHCTPGLHVLPQLLYPTIGQGKIQQVRKLTNSEVHLAFRPPIVVVSKPIGVVLFPTTACPGHKSLLGFFWSLFVCSTGMIVTAFRKTQTISCIFFSDVKSKTWLSIKTKTSKPSQKALGLFDLRLPLGGGLLACLNHT